MPTTETPRDSNSHWVRLTWLARLLALVLLFLASRDDLWFDEIWSMTFIDGSDYVTDLITVHHHGANHLVNTMFMYYIPDGSPAIAYRAF